MWYSILIVTTILGMSGCSDHIKEVSTEDIINVVSTQQPTEQPTKESKEEPMVRKKTAIVFDHSKVGLILSEQEAIEAINEEGAQQRRRYNNPVIHEIEERMQEEYGILQVNLGEMNEEMARKIESACSYMYDKYPILKGKVSNLTLGNLPGDNTLAKVDYREFIVPNDASYPIVMKHELILNARDFLNQERLQNTINRTVKASQWMDGMNIEGVIVHELGHSLIDVLRMEHYGITCPFYITKEQEEAYVEFNTDELASNQTMLKELLQDSFEEYKKGTGKDVTFEEFCKSISGYASGIQEDGGQSYDETCAEVFVDEYLHGQQCSESARYILNKVNEKIR